MINKRNVVLGLTLLFSVGVQTMPTYALEKEEQVCHINDASSLVDVLSNLYSVSLENVEYKTTRNKTLIYENEEMKIRVQGLDLKEEGDQKISVTYGLKDPSKSLKKLGFEDVSNVKSEFTIYTDVQVQDIQAPKILCEESYEIMQGEDFDLKKQIEVKDDSNVDVKISDSLDIETAGTYNVKITAIDESGNTSNKEVFVHVKKKQDPNFYQNIADAALAQLGVNQDCTMLVTNALRAVGINYHGAPESYLSLGELTSNPVPGDICVYQGHVAIYIGNGQAVHGGWNGYTTVVYSVQCANPLIGYVHVRQPS